jgi:hypothetical protein
MSSISNVRVRPLLVTGIALACLVSVSVRAQTTPTPTPPPAGETVPPPTPKPVAPSGVVLKVSDTVNLRFGLLLQPQADWTQDAASGGYLQNLLVRRLRFLVGGQMTKNVFFFFETENSRLGQSTTAAKSLTTGFSVLDAAAEWRIAKEFNVQAGLIRVPNSREALKSASTSLALDFSAYTFTASAAMGSSAGRDTGLMVRGYFANDKLEYRLGGFQGSRDAASHQSYRYVGRLQYNVCDTEVYAFPSYSANNLATRHILAFGAAYDWQKDYRGLTGDAFLDYPIGPGSVIATLEFQHLDGGSLLQTALPNSNIFTGETGFYFKEAKTAVYGRYEQREFTASDAKDEKRLLVGLNYYPYGHNFNIKVGLGRLYPRHANNTTQFTIQFQAYYF